MKICVAGQGAFGQKHLDALKRIPGVEVTSLVGGNQDSTAQIAAKYGVPHYTGDLSEGIKRADAVILTTPTKMHFRQGEQHANLVRRARATAGEHQPDRLTGGSPALWFGGAVHQAGIGAARVIGRRSSLIARSNPSRVTGNMRSPISSRVIFTDEV